MAKQTFTAGQILTAAQMTTLQTNDFNQTISTTKTSAYTLVASDAGTTIFCDSATPFTITFPASVFAVNDTFTIYNQGAGVVTVAPGVGATLQKSGNSATTSATLRQFASAIIRCQGGNSAAWQPIYHTYVDGCETGVISGGVISTPTNYSVTFAAGRFNVAPIVTASSYGAQKSIITFPNDPQATTSGFTVTNEPFSGSTITRVAWVAIQQGTN